ncbi:MAG TPA: hypothetical protein VI299_28640 [Polyangiales bacterium]
MDTEIFPSFKARYHDAGRVSVGSIANVLLVHWAATPLLYDVQRIRSESDGLLAAYPQGISGIHVIEESCGIAGAEARAATSAQIKVLGARLGCIAVVLLGRGFWASTLQALITSIAVFTRRETTIRFAASTEQLAGWFLDEHYRRTEQRLSQVRIDNAVAQLIAEAHGEPSSQERPAQAS